MSVIKKWDFEAENGEQIKQIIDDNFQNLNTDKVEKVEGKGLSTNDYTTPEKTKLAGIESGAQVNVVKQAGDNITIINGTISAKRGFTIVEDF